MARGETAQRPLPQQEVLGIIPYLALLHQQVAVAVAAQILQRMEVMEVLAAALLEAPAVPQRDLETLQALLHLKEAMVEVQLILRQIMVLAEAAVHQQLV